MLMFWTFIVDITLAGCFARALFSFYKNKNDLHVFSHSITESSCFTSFLQHQSSFLFSTFYFQCRLVGLHFSFFCFVFSKTGTSTAVLYFTSLRHIKISRRNVCSYMTCFCILYASYMRMVWNINILWNWNRIFSKHTLRHMKLLFEIFERFDSFSNVYNCWWRTLFYSYLIVFSFFLKFFCFF